MSATNNEIIVDAVVTKEKKPTLNAMNTKFMVFGNWLIERLIAAGQLTTENVLEARRTLGMFSSVDEQIVLYNGFVSELKLRTKDAKALIRANNKPPPKAKAAKVAGDADKKRGRKKNAVPEQDPILALNEQLVAAAQSDGPIVEAPKPEYVRAPKEPELAPTEPEVAAKPAAEKLADKEAAKTAKDAEKAAAKAAKDAEKETAKAAKDAEKETAKAAKDAEKAAAKAAKDAEKAAAKPAKKAAAVALPIPVLKRTSATETKPDDEEEEEELECDVFTHEGVEYLIDSTNCVYDRESQLPIGTYNATEKTLKLNNK